MLNHAARRVLNLVCAVALLGLMVPAQVFAAPQAPIATPRTEAAAAPRIHAMNALPLAADDEIPGVPLGSSPVADSLSVNDGDWVDVYSFTMAPGQVFSAELTMPAGRSYFMEIYNSSGTTVYSTAGRVDQSTPWDETHDRIQMPTSNTAGGTYYLVVWIADDNPFWGGYTITWQKYTRAGDDEITGAVSPGGSPVNGSLDWRTDPSDVYAFTLAEDDVLTLTLQGGAGSVSSVYGTGGFSMYPYQAGTTTVWGDWPTWGANQMDAGSNTVTKSYYCPPGGAGTVYVEVHAEISAATYILGYAITSPNLVRLSGANRYETSYEISKANFLTSNVAVLASGTSFADALCASGLAGVYDAPLLLIPPKLFNDTGWTPEGLAFRNEVIRLGVTDFLVVGGTSVVPDALVNQATDVCDVASASRYGGTDRYGTSAIVMDQIVNQSGGAPAVVLMARGDQFADALAAAPFAYANGYPILLTKPYLLPDPVITRLTGSTPDAVYLLGGTAAVSASVASQINAIVPDMVRKDGVDRYETALNFAKFVADDLGLASWSQVGLATGVNFPDALSGGAACGARGGVLLLTPSAELSDGVGTELGDHVGGIDRVTTFGGTSAISAGVQNEVEAILHP